MSATTRRAALRGASIASLLGIPAIPGDSVIEKKSGRRTDPRLDPCAVFRMGKARHRARYRAGGCFLAIR
jgi:hypothetical protein